MPLVAAIFPFVAPTFARSPIAIVPSFFAIAPAPMEVAFAPEA